MIFLKIYVVYLSAEIIYNMETLLMLLNMQLFEQQQTDIHTPGIII